MSFDTQIFGPLFAIFSVPDLNKDSLLILRPRFNTEIFLAREIRSQKKSIVAIYTFTYNLLIQSGDMHALPFVNDSRSTVIFGWTLSYSLKSSRAANEMPRVLKAGEAGPRQYDSRKSVYKPSDYLVSSGGLAKWTL